MYTNTVINNSHYYEIVKNIKAYEVQNYINDSTHSDERLINRNILKFQLIRIIENF